MEWKFCTQRRQFYPLAFLNFFLFCSPRRLREISINFLQNFMEDPYRQRLSSQSFDFVWPPPFNWVQLFDASVRNAQSPLVDPASILYPVSCPDEASVFCRKVKSSLRYQLNAKYTQTTPLN